MAPSSAKKILILSIVGLALLACCAVHIVHLSQPGANSFSEVREFKDNEVTESESEEQLGESDVQEKKGISA